MSNWTWAESTDWIVYCPVGGMYDALCFPLALDSNWNDDDGCSSHKHLYAATALDQFYDLPYNIEVVIV